MGMIKPLIRASRRFAALCALALVLLAASALAGCGSDDYANNPRPPAVLAVSVFVGEDQLAYSPRDFGAGPTQFIIVNQTGADQNVIISSDRDERSVKVAGQQSVKQKMTVEPGFLSIEADNSVGDPLEIEVGPKRESAQQDLNQP